jgi:hypothetical protein
MAAFRHSGINARFDMLGLGDEGRIATWRATLRMIADHPWFGTGQGTFSWAYPAYRQPDISMWGTWDRAHNTLLRLQPIWAYQLRPLWWRLGLSFSPFSSTG